MAHPANVNTARPHLPGIADMTRRTALLGLGAALTLGRTSLAIAAGSSDARFVVINVRGGLDGLAAVAPYGDPNLSRLRAPLMAGPVGTQGGMLYLGGFFGLHPAMPNLHAMFQSGEASVVHAVGNCAATRSHFEGQDYLQSGAPSLLASGWLNRALSYLPAAAGSVETGVAVDSVAPLLVRGPTTVAGWSPNPFIRPSAALSANIVALTQGDAVIGPAVQVGLTDSAAFASIQKGAANPAASLPSLARLAWTAGEFLAAPNGPRVAALETASFDTHFDQVNRLGWGLSALDTALLALKTTLGPAWAKTVVLTMTEFGRTAYMNGTSSGGTDHGTGFAMLLAGGAVAGGRVIVSKWPGLGSGQLYQGRDLAPTLDFRAVAMGVLQQHMGVSASAMPAIFPGATGLSAMSGLTRS